MSVTLARNRAVTFAAANSAAGIPITLNRNNSNGVTGNVVLGRFRRSDKSFTPIPPGTGLLNAVRVTAPRDASSDDGAVPTILANVLGFTAFDVERKATAMLGGGIGPGVLALNPTSNCSFDMRGSTATLNVQGAAVIVNSSNATAACHSGQPNMNVDELLVTGGLDNNFEAQVDLTGEVFTGRDPVPDPLLDLPEPGVPAPNYGNVKLTGNSSVTLSPGYYDKIEVKNGSATLQSGLYYINSLLDVNGGVFDASAGVLLFIGPNGSIKMTGNGTVTISAMTTGTYAGVPIFQARGNTNQAFFRGNNQWNIDGTIYIPSGQMSVGGTMDNFSTGLIADEIEIFGNGSIGVNFAGQFPPAPRFVFLVE